MNVLALAVILAAQLLGIVAVVFALGIVVVAIISTEKERRRLRRNRLARLDDAKELALEQNQRVAAWRKHRADAPAPDLVKADNEGHAFRTNQFGAMVTQ